MLVYESRCAASHPWRLTSFDNLAYFCRATLCQSDMCYGHVCVCLSFVASRCSIETAKHTITRTTPHRSLGALVSYCQLKHPKPGRQIHVWKEKSAIFNKKNSVHPKTVKYTRCFYER